jgi:uncharacterized membrane protein
MAVLKEDRLQLNVFALPSTIVWLTFSLVFFVTCFWISAIIPPFQSPDEFDHIKRAYLLTRGTFILHAPQGEKPGGMIDSGLSSYIDAYDNLRFHSDRKLTAEQISTANAIRWTGINEFSQARVTSYYFPLIYAPQAIGLVLGKAFGFSVDKSYRLARLLALSVSSLLACSAFLIYPPSPLVGALLIIPMSVFQFSSASLDGISTALSIFSISLFMRIVDEREHAKPWRLYGLTACVSLVVASRPYMLPLVGVIFGTYLYTRSRTSLLAGSVTLSVVLLWWIVAIGGTTGTRLAIQTYPRAPISTVISYYAADPLSFFTILRTTFSRYGRPYLESFFGILGWLDARFTEEIYGSFLYFLLAIGVFSVSLRFSKQELPARMFLIVAALFSFILIFPAVLLTNAHPATIIEGVQGRYFLIPALLLSYGLTINSRRESCRRFLVGVLLLSALLLYSTFQTTTLLLKRYYVFSEQSSLTLGNHKTGF